MKMTDFEVGKFYINLNWPDNIILEVRASQHGSTTLFIKGTDQIPPISLDDISSVDWRECKEPVDYGNAINHKLFLIKDAHYPSVWCEGWGNEADKIVFIKDGLSNVMTLNRDFIIKVIDLPSKEL